MTHFRRFCLHNKNKNAVTAASLLLGMGLSYGALSRLDAKGQRLKLARSEQPTTLTDGVGPVVRRKVWAQVHGTAHSAQDTIDNVLQHFAEYQPSLLSWVFRRRPRSQPVRQGEKLDIRLFLVRTCKVQVDDVRPLSFTIRTLRQHPDAGTVKISAHPIGHQGPLDPDTHDFELRIESVVRSSNAFDRAVYLSGIQVLQHADWEIVLSRALEYAGGQVALRDALIEEYPYTLPTTSKP